MHMRMSVRLATVPVKRMLMLVMLVMRMRMRVRHRLVNVLVCVIFSDVQPNTKSHADSGNPEGACRGLPVQNQGHCRTDKGCCGEIRACAGRSQLPQCYDKQHEA